MAGFCTELVTDYAKELWLFRKTLLTVLMPIILIPLAFGDERAKCGYVALVMGAFWMGELLPIGVTSLMPVVLFPLLGVMKSKDVSINYLKDSNMLFIGGLVMAIAVENCNLHKRVALKVLLMVGAEPRWLMLGFMGVTWFLSMWISNTATTAMMLPIVEAVLDQLKKDPKKYGSVEDDKNNLQVPKRKVTLTKTSSNQELVDEENEDAAKNSIPIRRGSLPPPSVPESRTSSGNTANNVPRIEMQIEEATDDDDDEQISDVMLTKGMILCVAFSANIGGTATLTGTSPNLILLGQLETLYANESILNFASWFLFAIPGAFLCVVMAWLWMQLWFFGWRTLCGCFLGKKQKSQRQIQVRNVIRSQYQELGRISFAEVVVLINFVCLVLLWLTRDPKFVAGWASLFPKGYTSDATPAIFIVLCLFLCPRKRPTFLCCKPSVAEQHTGIDNKPEFGPQEAILDWKTVHMKLPWNVVFLMGAGYALAEASHESGLSALIGEQLEILRDVDPVLVLLFSCTMIGVLTQFFSNSASIALLLPIVADLAEGMRLNPLYLMLPLTIAASFAFMLPVATPPNAIAYATGKVTVWDMVKAGFTLNVTCILVIILTTNTYGMVMFGLNDYPSWAGSSPTKILANTTTPASWL